MATTTDRKQCPHCGLWLNVEIDWKLEQNYAIRVRGVVPKKESK